MAEHFRHDEVAGILRGIHQRLEVFVDPRHFDSVNPLQAIFERLDDARRLLEKRFQQLENMIMTTAAEFQAKLDSLRDEVAAEKSVEDSAVTLLTGLVTQVKSLQDQIAALQAGGAGLITQDQLDALAAEADAITSGAQANIAPLAAAVAANTPAAAPAAPPADAPPAAPTP